MNKFVSDDGQKRRLPVWMMGSKKSDENIDSNKDKHEEKPRVGKQPLEAKCETKRGKRKLNQPKLEIGEKRKRKLSKQNVGFERKGQDDEDRRAVWESESTNQERGKAKEGSSMVESDEEIESWSENDAELTVEDLMSFAKEYVKDDKDMEQRPSGSHDAPQSKATCINSLTENSTSERIVVKSTGNPTQDMLDLFLGPLLKKTTEEDKKIASISEDITFSYDYKPKNQKNVLEEDLAPLMKKKSSLKDKVAMFLD